MPNPSCHMQDLSYDMQALSCGMRDLTTWPGIKPKPPALRTWSLTHWTTREVPNQSWFLWKAKPCCPCPPPVTPGKETMHISLLSSISHLLYFKLLSIQSSQNQPPHLSLWGHSSRRERIAQSWTKSRGLPSQSQTLSAWHPTCQVSILRCKFAVQC